MSSRNRVTVALMLVLAAGLAGCGKKGDPEYPQGTQLQSVKKPDGTSEKKPVPPKRPFVLDGLLN